MLRSVTRSLTFTATAAIAFLGVGAVSPAATSAAPTAPERMPAPVINEVETNGDDVDWVEFANPSDEAMDLSGYVFTDAESEKHAYTLPSETVIPAGGLFVVSQEEKAAPGFDFGLGSEDAVRLFEPGAPVTGEPLVEYSWTNHAKVTWGRCPDVTGDFVDTFASSPGAANVCEDPGEEAPSGSSWPGGQGVLVLDGADEDRGDWSGIDVEPLAVDTAPDGARGSQDSSSQDSRLWVVQNGDGELYRLSSQDNGDSWNHEAGWRLRYADGSGTVDAEGITFTSDSARGIYVSSERDNDVSKTSRPSVLRYDLPTDRDGDELKAAQEWNLAADFPGLGANAGLEGITWIPDRWLTERTFVDQAEAAPYDPATYPGHGDGLFAVAVEGAAHVYVYALQENGGFQRVATVDPDFDSVADVQFDADRNQLWVVCDDACDGQIATFQLSEGEFTKDHVYNRPAETNNYGNEGFAIAPLVSCTDGAVNTYYVDDNNTDGHSLRSGTLDAMCPAPEPSESSDPAETVQPTASDPPATGPPTAEAGDAPATSATEATSLESSDSSPTAGSAAETAGSDTTETETTSHGSDRTDAMASTGVPAGTWLVAAGSLLLVVAGLIMFRAARQH